MKRLWHRLSAKLAGAWLAFALSVGDFLEEAAFRVGLAFDILAGRVPFRVERRPWLRSRETPALMDAFSWIDDRLLFSVLVWPSLETAEEEADQVFGERVEEVLEAIAKGAPSQAWSLYWEVDYGVVWDPYRAVWVDSGGHRYEGSRFDHLRHHPRRDGTGEVAEARRVTHAA